RRRLVALSPAQRARIEETFGAVDDVLPISPLQEGLLFHLQLAQESGVADLYASQSRLHLRGHVDPERLDQAIAALLHRNPNLTAGFAFLENRAVQVVPEQFAIPLRTVRAPGDRSAHEDLFREERGRPFAANRPPLLRFL